MQVDHAMLRSLHHVLKMRTDLRDRLERGPRRIRVAETAEQSFVQNLENLKNERLKTQLAADEKQLHLAEREARIETAKIQRNGVSSNREYQLLTDQIAADETANTVLQDEILELLEKLDELESQIQTAEAELEQARSETARVRDAVLKEREQLQQELDQVQRELADHESQLPGELAEEYRRLVEHIGEDALAGTDLETCGHCHSVLTAQTRNELLLNQPVFCKSCHSILYLAADAARPG